MASLEKITVDVTQEIIHDQIKKLAEALYEQSKVKLTDVRIDWHDFTRISSYIEEIRIETSKKR
jgi:hypothetical protein